MLKSKSLHDYDDSSDSTSSDTDDDVSLVKIIKKSKIDCEACQALLRREKITAKLPTVAAWWQVGNDYCISHILVSTALDKLLIIPKTKILVSPRSTPWQLLKIVDLVGNRPVMIFHDNDYHIEIPVRHRRFACVWKKASNLQKKSHPPLDSIFDTDSDVYASFDSDCDAIANIQGSFHKVSFFFFLLFYFIPKNFYFRLELHYTLGETIWCVIFQPTSR
jgi:hypothetical protein